MRTVVYSYKPVALNALIELEQEEKIELVNFFTEGFADNSKVINILPFLCYYYGADCEKLIEKYTKDIKHNEKIYSKIFSQIHKIIENVARHDKDYQQQTFPDFINHFNIWYRFCYGYLLKEKIDLLILMVYPHCGFDNILYLLAKELNIKTIILMQESQIESNLPIITYCFDAEEDACNYKNMTEKIREVNLQIENKFEKDLHYMKNAKVYDYKFEMPRRKIFKIIKYLIEYGLIKNCKLQKIVSKNIFYQFYTEYRKSFLANNYISNYRQSEVCADYNQKYVYYPLHFQPELTTSFYGEKYYSDQLLVLEKLNDLIPDNWIIYIKDHKIQTEYQRPNSFFKRLQFIKKARLISKNENTYKLIRHSQFVSTVSGTAAYEAVCGGKPALIFGKIWWQNLPGIFKYNENININDIINYKIDHNLLSQKINEFYSKCHVGILCDETSSKLIPNYSETENIKTLKTLLSGLIDKVNNNKVVK